MKNPISGLRLNMNVRLPGTNILGQFDGIHYKDIYSGKIAKSPSGFARLAYPDAKSINGWKVIEFQDKHGKWKPLDSLRTSRDVLAPFRRVCLQHPPTAQKTTLVNREAYEDAYLKWWY